MEGWREGGRREADAVALQLNRIEVDRVVYRNVGMAEMKWNSLGGERAGMSGTLFHVCVCVSSHTHTCTHVCGKTPASSFKVLHGIKP